MTISKPTTRKIKVLTDILSKEREAKGFYKIMAIVFGVMFLIFAYFYANGISAKPAGMPLTGVVFTGSLPVCNSSVDPLGIYLIPETGPSVYNQIQGYIGCT